MLSYQTYDCNIICISASVWQFSYKRKRKEKKMIEPAWYFHPEEKKNWRCYETVESIDRFEIDRSSPRVKPNALLYLSNTKSRIEYIISVRGIRTTSTHAEGWKAAERRARAGNYIDCVAGWQRQWHMSPRLLVIADLNMRRSPQVLAKRTNTRHFHRIRDFIHITLQQ